MIIRVADLTVRTIDECDYVRHICRNYTVSDQPAELTVTLKSTDPLEQSIELLRRVNDTLIQKNTFLIHSSALALDNMGYLFAAHSGTGKSTHASMWRKVFGSRVTMINDDKPFLKVDSSGVTVFGSPWDGKHHLSTNTSVPLKALCFLKRGKEDVISPFPPSQALNHIFDQIPRSEDAGYMLHLLELLDKLFSTIPLYQLECTPTENAALVAFHGMNGDII